MLFVSRVMLQQVFKNLLSSKRFIITINTRTRVTGTVTLVRVKRRSTHEKTRDVNQNSLSCGGLMPFIRI